MEQFFNLKTMALISETSSRKEKEKLLKADMEPAKELFRLALDTGLTFGITWDEQWNMDYQCSNGPGNHLLAEDTAYHTIWWNTVIDTLNRCANRKLRGNDARSTVRSVALNAPTYTHLVWFSRIVDRDLRCGVQSSTVNNVWPGTINLFEVMLCAKAYDPAKTNLNGFWSIEPKLDGLRMLVTVDGAFTRNGKKITSVDHILKALRPMLLDGFVFDGEVMGGGAFDEASGIVRRKDEAALSAKYMIFDMISDDEWATKKFHAPYHLRRETLESVEKNNKWLPDFIKIVPYTLIENPLAGDVVLKMNQCVSDGYEGVILKDAEAPYEPGRSRSMLKAKPFDTIDAKITGYVEGKGKYKEHLGVFIVEHNGNTSEVGSGFSDSQRLAFWKNKESLIGRVVECQYQNLTEKGVMRFPVFLRFRDDKD